MKTLLFLSSVFVATSLFASDSDLLKSAQDSGLAPLPTTQSEIEIELEKIGVKPNVFSDKKVALGTKLYFEPRLSRSGIISCNTCHNLGLAGTDGISASTGHAWSPNPHHVNAPTTFNAVFAASQFWDGRAGNLSDQAKGPLQAEPEMYSTPELVEARISSIPEYEKEFKEIYKDGVTFDNVADAIATFERTLVTPSKFDDFLKGDLNALNSAQKEGLQTFIDKGCAACHNGVALGGSKQAFEVAGKYKFADIGDFKGDENGMVKTPTLRNIAKTAPYFHNGAIWSLNEAIKSMGSIQLGIEISDDEAQKINAFLQTLTGKMPEIIYPELPASTDKTPKPILDQKGANATK